MRSAAEGFVISIGDAIDRIAAPPPYEEDEETVTLAEKLGVTPERLAGALALVPPTEQDMVHLYYVVGKRQSDIARIYGVTQASVSYKLARAFDRMRFVLSLPVMTEAELRAELLIGLLPESTISPRALRLEIMICLWKTTCQNETAKLLGTTQGRVRHVVFREAAHLEERAKHDLRVKKSAEWFAGLIAKKAWNSKREVILPQWTRSKARAMADSPYGEMDVRADAGEAGSGVRRRVVGTDR